MRSRDEQRALALGLMVHAIDATKPHTAEEVEACNARFARARDFLQHASARDVISPVGHISPADMEDLRPDALRNLRARCAACGLCPRFGIEPP